MTDAQDTADEFPEPPPRVLDENQTAQLNRVDREVAALRQALDDAMAAAGKRGEFVIRIPNPTGEISKIMMRYSAGNQEACRYKEFTRGVGIPLEMFKSMPALPIQYRIIPDSKDDIIVRFQLTPGYCYRIICRTAIADYPQPPFSLGFFEVSKLRNQAPTAGR